MKILRIFFLMCLFSNLSFSQSTNQISQKENLEEDSGVLYQNRKNIPKFNVTSVVFRNFQLQYERVLNKKFSGLLTYSLIPEGDLPMKDLLVDSVEEEDLNRFLQSSSLQYSSFTPELRIYFGDGYGKGFYLAPFYRHTKYQINDVHIFYNSEGGGEGMVNTSGDISSNTFGLQIGSQFNLGSRIVLDWFIIGPHYGSATGGISGVAENELTSNEQADLRDGLDFVDSLIGDFSYKVDSKGAEINVDGPWAGIRAGFAIGYRF